MSARLERFVWDGPYAGSFEPTGPVLSHGPARKQTPPVLAGRVVVGFGTTPAAGSLEGLVDVTREVRGRQDDVDPVIIAQAGKYRHRTPTAGFIAESGAQVIVVGPGHSRRIFEAQMIELAEVVAREFGQDIVVLDMQEDALTQVVHCVSP